MIKRRTPSKRASTPSADSKFIATGPQSGRNGLDNDYSKKEDLIEHEGKLCEKYCDVWNQELSFWGRRLGHNYQKEDKALEYYLTSMKEHCDNKC